ncbi:BON domain-containing protein [Halopseudomonas sp.]|uniref:BON domain-containing protein n=1 Tax=Halopseudomonas sp. TaxID=2901191 RepID=UPI00311E6640
MHSALPQALLALSTSLIACMAFSAPGTGSYLMEQNLGVIVQSNDDSRVTRALQHRLAWQGNTQGIQIRVKVRNGVARLSGTVLNPSDVRVATETARHTPGVTRVDNSALMIANSRPVNLSRPTSNTLPDTNRLSL